MIGNVNVPGALAADIANKVDKVSGKGLSSNDFIDEYKSKLDNIDTVVTSNSDNLVTSNAVYNALTQNQSDLFSYIAISYTTISDISVSTVFIGRDDNEFKTQFRNNFKSFKANIYIYGKENSYFDMSNFFNGFTLPYVNIYFMNKFILKPDASYAFGNINCGSYSGSSIDLSNIDTSNVTNMSYMFSCARLSTLKLGPEWDMRNVTNKTDMFSGCSSNLKVYYCNTNDTYNQLIAAGLSSSQLVLRTDINY